MATISSPGIGSGLDVQSIVSQLVALDRAPLTQLRATATNIQTKLSTYGTIKSQVATLGDAATKLSTSSGWNGVTATSSNPSAIAVTATSGAPTTALTMEVSQLAKAQTSASVPFAAGANVGSGSISIELGTWSGTSFSAGSAAAISININAGEDSLAEIAAKINDANAGVSATVLKDASGERLLMRSKETGAENSFRLTVTDDDGSASDGSGLSNLGFDLNNSTGMAQTQAGQNAEATVNGVSISSASNRLADTLPGMTIQLSQITTAPVEIDVSQDLASVRANVQAFVDAYNTLNTTLSSATRYDAGTQTAGTLQGDSTATGLQNALRGMMRSVSSSSPYSRLSDIGIELKTGGALSINTEKFEAALNRPDDLRNLFTVATGSPATEGFGLKMKAFSEGLINTDGWVTNRTNALQKSIDRNTLDQERVTDRASRSEARYLAQYNAMDANVARLNSINSFITQQISLWNKSG